MVELYRMQAEHPIALRREEEKGYARGLADGARQPRPITHDAVMAAASILAARGSWNIGLGVLRAALEAAEAERARGDEWELANG